MSFDSNNYVRNAPPKHKDRPITERPQTRTEIEKKQKRKQDVHDSQSSLMCSGGEEEDFTKSILKMLKPKPQNFLIQTKHLTQNLTLAH